MCYLHKLHLHCTRDTVIWEQVWNGKAKGTLLCLPWPLKDPWILRVTMINSCNYCSVVSLRLGLGMWEEHDINSQWMPSVEEPQLLFFKSSYAWHEPRREPASQHIVWNTGHGDSNKRCHIYKTEPLSSEADVRVSWTLLNRLGGYMLYHSLLLTPSPDIVLVSSVTKTF